MASRKAKKLREEVSSAEIITFPVIARREIGDAATLPFPVVPARPSEHVSSKAAPNAANENDRPTLPMPRRGRWWEIAIVLSAIVHVVLFAAMWERNNYDLERAAGAAAALNEGSTVVPIEVLTVAALPSAPTPVEATEPDETKVTKTIETSPESKKEEKTEAAPPQKNDDAPDVVPTAKESPKPEKEKHEQKKKEASAASHTAAASPSRAAASGSQGRAGAGGRLANGGTANMSSYQAQVFAHLQRYKSYPSGAGRAGLRAAVVHFTLAANGHVISASLGRSSGVSAFDQAALSMVRRASPFPSIPANLGVSTLLFNAPIRFQ